MKVSELCSKGYASNLLNIVGNDEKFYRIKDLINFIKYIQKETGKVPQIIEFTSKGNGNPLTKSEIKELIVWLEDNDFIRETKKGKYELQEDLLDIFECLITKNCLSECTRKR